VENNSVGSTRSKPSLPYDQWLKALMHDKDVRPEIIREIPEFVLVEWWEEGIEPTSRALAAMAQKKNTNPLESTA
jgi:hypothetical protein